MTDTVIRVQRNLGRVEDLSPAEWTDETITGEPAVACPNCGRVDAAADETVQPWACVVCAWDGWIALTDHGEPVLR